MNENKTDKTAFGVASLCCGIIGILLTIAPYLGLPLGVLAIIFSRYNKSGVSTAGLVTGIIGVVFNAFLLFFLLIVLLIAGGF